MAKRKRSTGGNSVGKSHRFSGNFARTNGEPSRSGVDPTISAILRRDEAQRNHRLSPFTVQRVEREMFHVKHVPQIPATSESERNRPGARQSQAAQLKAQNKPVGAEPARSDDRMRDQPTCKKRPTNTKGSGGSRPFVPWCGK